MIRATVQRWEGVVAAAEALEAARFREDAIKGSIASALKEGLGRCESVSKR